VDEAQIESGARRGGKEKEKGKAKERKLFPSGERIKGVFQGKPSWQEEVQRKEKEVREKK